MTNRFEVLLHLQDVRWAAVEGVSETVIAADLLLHERSVDEIVPKLSAAELEQVIKLVGRSPSVYPPGTLDALKQRKALVSPEPPQRSGDGGQTYRRISSTPAPPSTLIKCAEPTSTGSQCSARIHLRARRSPGVDDQAKKSGVAGVASGMRSTPSLRGGHSDHQTK